MSIGHTPMSIRPLDEQKCPLDIHMSIRPMANRNVHSTFKCPFVHWANRNVQWTFKCPFVQWTNRNVQWTFTGLLDILQRYWTCMTEKVLNRVCQINFLLVFYVYITIHFIYNFNLFRCAVLYRIDLIVLSIH